jgi:hypothetical protein
MAQKDWGMTQVIDHLLKKHEPPNLTYSKESKSDYYRDTHVYYSSIHSSQIMESAIKKNEIMSIAGKRVELENITLSDISQSYNDKYHMFSLICGVWEETK